MFHYFSPMKISPIGKTAKHKTFEYIPRYWNPEEEEKKKRRHSIQFERKTSRGQGRSIIMYILILCAILYILVSF
jgi:hypothetical protein